MALVMNNPDILRCSQLSVLSCIDDGAFLGLDITGKGLKEAYLIPYKDKLTMIPAYYGLLKLVRQSKEIGSVDCQLVHEFDKCEWSLGTAPIVEHQPAPPSTRGEVSAVYAIAHWAISNIPPIVEWMWKEEIETIRNGSPAKNSDPWKYHWGEMARKTVLRRICKRLPKSEKVDRAVYLSDSHERPDFSNGNDIVDAEQTMKPTADKLVDKLH